MLTARQLLNELLKLESQGVDMDMNVFFDAPNLSPYDEIDIDFVTASDEEGVVLHSNDLLHLDEDYSGGF